MAEDQSLSQCLTLGAEGENGVPHRPNPANPRQHRPVILDLTQNPQGGGIPLYRADSCDRVLANRLM